MRESDQATLPSSNAGQDVPDAFCQAHRRPVSRQARIDALSPAVGVWHATLYGIALWAVLLVGFVVIWRLL